MSPADLIFQSFSNLTGGLVNDLVTVIVGLITLGFMVVAVNKIQSVLLGKRLDDYINDRGLGGEYEKFRNDQIIRAKFRHDHRDL
jgi:hypothetical protein